MACHFFRSAPSSLLAVHAFSFVLHETPLLTVNHVVS